MKKYLLAMLVIGLVLVASPVFAEDEALEADEELAEKSGKIANDEAPARMGVNLGSWFASYNGEIEVADKSVVGGATVLGEKLDFEDDLGLENPQNAIDVEVWGMLGKNHRISIGFYSVKYEGDEELDVDVELAGYTFQVGTDLDTYFEFSRIRLAYEWFILNNDTGRLGLMTGIDYYLWEFGYEGTETTTGLSESDSETLPVPVPVIGISGGLNFGYGIGANIKFVGMGVAYDEFEASYSSLDVGLTYDYKYLHAGLGYRTINNVLKAEDDDEFELEYSTVQDGLIVTVGMQF
jgi:hypothetical protein